MIQISRSPVPDVLSENAEAWTEELLADLAAGKNPQGLSDRYGHPDVRAVLASDAANKCMYCEAKISHVSFPHVEHIAPKAASKYPERTFDWDNLGLACQACNTKKGTKYDPDSPPVDPYSEDPSAHVYAFGEVVLPIPGSDRGFLTIQDVGLNRTPLLEARARRLEAMRSMAEAYARTENPEVKAAFLQELCAELKSDREFSMFTNALVQGTGIKCEE